MRKRVRSLRRAWRHFWWMVVRRRGYKPTLSRRTYAGIAFRMALCGLMTGGEHSWGPLHRSYEDAPRRKRDCRWCGASMTPAEEFKPMTDEELREAEKWIAKPTPDLAERAKAQLEREGILRDGKLLWED